MALGHPDIKTYAESVAFLRNAGVSIPLDLETRACVAASRGSLKEFGPSTPAREVAAMWLSLLSGRQDDLLVSITLLLLLDGCVHFGDSRWQEMDAALQEQQTLSGRPMTAAGTMFEIKRRLAARFFDLGRRGKVSESNRILLREAISRFDELLLHDRAAVVPKVRLKYVGMRGVAYTLLARSDSEPTRVYELVCRDLEESRELGDHSAEHDQYLIEAYVKRLDATGDLSLLSRAQTIVDEALLMHPQARGLLTQNGEIVLRRGMLLPKTASAEESLSLFRAALESFENALEAAPHQSFSDEYIRLKRGTARFRLYIAASKAGSADRSLLENAIVDLDRSNGSDERSNLGLTLPWALTTRAHLHAANSDFALAVTDLRRAASLAEGLPDGASTQQLREVIGTRLATARMNTASASDDADEILRVASSIMDGTTPDHRLVGPLTYAGRVLLKHSSPDVARILRIATFAESVALNPEFDQVSRSFAAAQGAGLLHLLARAKLSDAHLPRAHRLFSFALSIVSDPPPEWWGFAGEVALRLGKKFLAIQNDAEAVPYLEDASTWISAAIETARRSGEESSFRFREAYSKLGEAYVRLHAVTMQDADAESAVRALRETVALGNSTPQVFGLLGDVYYRRGRLRGSLDDLREARILKNRARETPNDDGSERSNWRENLSVSAAISFRIFKQTNEPDDLVDAVITARRAVHEDASWPWPLFQLADLAAAARPMTLRPLLVGHADDEIVRLVLEGESDELNRRACGLAIQNPLNFNQKILGGRQKVYVLRDPHRLLSESFVFKPTTDIDAQREMQAVSDFRGFLNRTGAPRTFRLPVPLMIIKGERSQATYVMRRSEGIQLGTFALRTIRATDAAPMAFIDGAITFLAHYHAWRRSVSAVAPRPSPLERTLRSIGRLWKAIFGPGVASELLTRLRTTMQYDLPLLPKKDAHPENWLVTPHGEIVMLDLEAQTSLPLLFEVAQFLEDYPIFNCTMDGWKARQAVIDHYLLTLARLDPRFPMPPSPALRTAYESFALVRAAFGIGHTRSSQSLSSSSSVLRAVTARQRHYRSLSEFLATYSSTAEIRDAAAYVVRATAERTAAPPTMTGVRRDDLEIDFDEPAN